MKRIVTLLLALSLLMALVPMASAEVVIYATTKPLNGATAALRVLPGDNRPVIQDVPNGNQIKVLYEGSTWHKVYVVSSGKTGWMRSDDIKMSSRGMSATDYGSVLDRSGYINLASNNTATLRWGPEEYYDEITYLQGGTRLWIYESTGNWHRVRTVDGLVGYVSKSLVSVTNEVIDFGPNALGFVQVSGNYAGFLKALPAGNGNHANLMSGDVVQIVAREGKYYYVIANDGREGYIFYNLLSVGGLNKTLYTANLYYDASSYSDIIRTTPAGQTVKVLATDGNFARVKYDEHEGYVRNIDLIYRF